MGDVLYPELSYRIIGIAFEIFNELGSGYNEKVYEKAFASELKKKKIDFSEQLKCDLFFNGEKIAHYFLDFLVESRVIVELKVGDFLSKKDYQQVRRYLKLKGLELGILILFSKTGVTYKRILNRI